MHDLDGPHVVVLGLMGVGKSTTAEAFAEKHDLGCFDSDLDIETVFGQTGGELADRLGVGELHRLEAAMLLGRLAHHEPSVISAAASIIEHEHCRMALRRRAFVVTLRAPIDLIMERSATGAHRRPMSRDELAALHDRRAPLFAKVSHLELDAALPTNELVTHMTMARATRTG